MFNIQKGVIFFQSCHCFLKSLRTCFLHPRSCNFLEFRSANDMWDDDRNYPKRRMAFASIMYSLSFLILIFYLFGIFTYQKKKKIYLFGIFEGFRIACAVMFLDITLASLPYSSEAKQELYVAYSSEACLHYVARIALQLYF